MSLLRGSAFRGIIAAPREPARSAQERWPARRQPAAKAGTFREAAAVRGTNFDDASGNGIFDLNDLCAMVCGHIVGTRSSWPEGHVL